MNRLAEFKEMTVEQLNSELLSLRKEQFNLRLKKSNGTLDKIHLISQVRKEIARVKTLLTQALRCKDGK